MVFDLKDHPVQRKNAQISSMEGAGVLCDLESISGQMKLSAVECPSAEGQLALGAQWRASSCTVYRQEPITHSRKWNCTTPQALALMMQEISAFSADKQPLLSHVGH